MMRRSKVKVDMTQHKKYGLIWDNLTFSKNKYIRLDVTVDESTWANSLNANVHSGINNKPRASKDGHHIVLSDSERRFIYAYTPRQKFFQRQKPFTSQGPAKVKRLVEIIKPLVKGASKEWSNDC